MAATVIITCDNKGCHQQDYHKLDVESNKIFCGSCKQEVTNTSEYIKKVLKSSNQTFKRVSSSNEMTCKSCGLTADPVLLEYGNDVFEVACGRCKTANTHLTNYFIEPLKINPEIRRVRVRIAKSGADNEGEKLFDEIAPNEDLAHSEPPVKASPPVQQVSVGSWLSPKKADRGAPPPGSVDAEIAAQALAAQNVNANLPIQGTLSPVQRSPSTKKYTPPSPEEMLGRVGVKYTGDFADEEVEDEPARARPQIKKSPSNKPKTAAEMLDRAGFELASTEEPTYETEDAEGDLFED